MASTRSFVALVSLLAAGATELPHDDIAAEESALAEDAQCAGSGASSEHCALNAMQLRTRKVLGDVADVEGAAKGITVPSGVNLGGWYVLEDWMFSGDKGRHVLTPGDQGQGLCLPPLLHTSKEKNETWPSEGILTKWLERTRGKDEVVEILNAHRKEYITDKDFEQIAGLGVKEVRVPLPWTVFADALSSLDPDAYAPGAKIVPDPFYFQEASFVAVHQKVVKKMLRTAGKNGLKIYLDMHTMPGGSSDATYNGIWPLMPQFWMGNVRIGNTKMPLEEVGMMIAKAFIHFVEHLPQEERSVVAGMTLLNEPAHMSHIDKTKGKVWVKSEKQVMDWVEKASDLFRQSSLPGRGVKLHVSIIESAFQFYWDTAPPWYMKTFTKEERHSWAIYDMHFYDAWTPKCSGRANGGPAGGGYTCDQPLNEIRPLIHECHHKYMTLFEKDVDGLKACTEFSLATFEDPVFACNDDKLLQMYLDEQVQVFKHFKIQPFFWTWRMPHGRNFQKAWSLKHLAGLETPPAVSC